MALRVIVPVYNALATLPDCLGALLGQEHRPDWHVVVVDNGSTDGGREWLRRLELDQQMVPLAGSSMPLTVLEETRRGPAAARNAGLRAAPPEVDLFVLLDADCIPPPGWLVGLVTEFERHPDWDAAGGALRTTEFGNAVEEFIERQGIMDVAGFYESRPRKPPLVLTANMILRRRALDLAGLLDETLPVGEDADWCWRLQWAGGALGYLPGASVAHRHRTTVGRFIRMMYSYGRGSVAVYARHRERLVVYDPNGPVQGGNGRVHLELATVWRLFRSMGKCVLIPFRRLTPYQRAEAPLEVLRYGAFLAGRLRGSLEQRVIVI